MRAAAGNNHVMTREAIPAEIRRAVLCEAGHRCAIPTCRYPDIDVHHIVPWEVRKSHDFENLIALCPNCHRRADAGEIDRKSLRWYKSQLSASVSATGEILEAMPKPPTGRISEVQAGNPGYEFQFEYPIFDEPTLQVIGGELEVWGNTLLQAHRREHALDEPFTSEHGGPNTTEAAFEIVRQDSTVLSIKYRVHRYWCGAAHGGASTVTKTYLRNTLYRIDLVNVFAPHSKYLALISEYCRAELLRAGRKDEAWVRRGTEPEEKYFRAFNVSKSGLLLSFDEYQVDCFGAGPQAVEIPYEQLRTILNPRLPRLWWPNAPL